MTEFNPEYSAKKLDEMALRENNRRRDTAHQMGIDVDYIPGYDDGEEPEMPEDDAMSNSEAYEAYKDEAISNLNSK
jgi:hypothetical protein